MTEFAIEAPVDQPRSARSFPIVGYAGSSASRSCTARWRAGSCDVRTDATEGFVHDACATAASKTTASFAKASSSGVVFRG